MEKKFIWKISSPPRSLVVDPLLLLCNLSKQLITSTDKDLGLVMVNVLDLCLIGLFCCTQHVQQSRVPIIDHFVPNI